MWLILCDSTDVPARWAHQGLRQRGMEPVELVTSDELAHARWSQQIGGGSEVVEVALRDGRVLRSSVVQGTLNRLLYPPAGDLLLIRPADRNYVFQELMAIFTSWLGAMAGRVFNPPAPECLSGRLRSLTEWFWLAGKAGLASPSYRVSSADAPCPPTLHVRVHDAPLELTTLLVVGDTIVGPSIPAAIADGCRRLASLAHVPLLGLEFFPHWELAGVNARPDLTLGGDAFLDALAASFRNGSAQG